MKTAVKWRYPEATERQIGRSLQTAIRDLVVEMRKRTKSIRFDDTSQEIDDAESDFIELAKDLIANLIAALPSIALSMYQFNAREFIRMAKATGGNKNPAVLLLIAYGANANEDWYNDTYSTWESLTVASYQKLFQNVISDWSTTVRNAALTGKSGSQVKSLSEQRFKVYTVWSQNRAAGIAGSWYSALMRQRIADTGVTHYFWRGVMDLREREKHVKWEGKRIPVNSDHVFPGEEYRCRCWPVPDWGSNNK